MNKLLMGVIGTSKKMDERRLPIHPANYGDGLLNTLNSHS